MKRILGIIAAVTLTIGGALPTQAEKTLTLLNVSYDPTRELYKEYNAAFAKHWKDKTGDNVNIKQSHDGSGKQARSVMEGLDADVVTLALSYDIDAIANRSHAVPLGWQKLLPNNSAPLTSTIVFLVRKGNPKGIKDWSDLIKPGITVVTPNPKTSGGARWNYLAAYGFELKRTNGNEEKAKEFIKALFKNVPVLDTGARGATTTFAQRGVGDVLIAWESEALMEAKGADKDKFDIVIPSVSIKAEPPVAVVDRGTRRHGTAAVAKAYLEFLYTNEGQEIGAHNYYRPSSEAVAKKHADLFPAMNLFTVDEVFGGWAKAQAAHFNDGGTFDKIFQK